MSRKSLPDGEMQSNIDASSRLPTLGATMAPYQHSTKAHKPFDISNLMSPPDAVFDSFGNPTNVRNGTPKEASTDKAPLAAKMDEMPMSPPISPDLDIKTPTKTTTSLESPVHIVKDPVLYPQDDRHSSPSSSNSPLFAPIGLEHHQTVNTHIRNRSPDTFRNGGIPPKNEDYDLVLQFRWSFMPAYERDMRGWKSACRREHDERRAARKAAGVVRPWQQKIRPAPAPAVKKHTSKDNRVTKPRAIRASGNVVNGVSTAPVKSRRPSATPKPEHSSRRSTAPNREDKDFNALPDFQPPVNVLPDDPKRIKVEWSTKTSLDLSGDPLASLLHPVELYWASNLRLDPATYLTSKRRIFIRRLKCLGIPKDFKKTDAQQACKIDVNKASKLWEVFDKAGWLDEHWMDAHRQRLNDLDFSLYD